MRDPQLKLAQQRRLELATRESRVRGHVRRGRSVRAHFRTILDVLAAMRVGESKKVNGTLVERKREGWAVKGKVTNDATALAKNLKEGPIDSDRGYRIRKEAKAGIADRDLAPRYRKPATRMTVDGKATIELLGVIEDAQANYDQYRAQATAPDETDEEGNVNTDTRRRKTSEIDPYDRDELRILRQILNGHLRSLRADLKVLALPTRDRERRDVLEALDEAIATAPDEGRWTSKKGLKKIRESIAARDEDIADSDLTGELEKKFASMTKTPRQTPTDSIRSAPAYRQGTLDPATKNPELMRRLQGEEPEGTKPIKKFVKGDRVTVNVTVKNGKALLNPREGTVTGSTRDGTAVYVRYGDPGDMGPGKAGKFLVEDVTGASVPPRPQSPSRTQPSGPKIWGVIHGKDTFEMTEEEWKAHQAKFPNAVAMKINRTPAKPGVARGPTGRLRNIKAMSDEKLRDLGRQVANEGTDATAAKAIMEEIDRRKGGASTVSKLDSKVEHFVSSVPRGSSDWADAQKILSGEKDPPPDVLKKYAKHVPQGSKYWSDAQKLLKGDKPNLEPAKAGAKDVPIALIPVGSTVTYPGEMRIGIKNFPQKVGNPVDLAGAPDQEGKEFSYRYWDGVQWDYVGPTSTFDVHEVPAGKGIPSATKKMIAAGTLKPADLVSASDVSDSDGGVADWDEGPTGAVSPQDLLDEIGQMMDIGQGAGTILEAIEARLPPEAKQAGDELSEYIEATGGGSESDILEAVSEKLEELTKSKGQQADNDERSAMGAGDKVEVKGRGEGAITGFTRDGKSAYVRFATGAGRFPVEDITIKEKGTGHQSVPRGPGAPAGPPPPLAIKPTRRLARDEPPDPGSVYTGSEPEGVHEAQSQLAEIARFHEIGVEELTDDVLDQVEEARRVLKDKLSASDEETLRYAAGMLLNPYQDEADQGDADWGRGEERRALLTGVLQELNARYVKSGKAKPVTDAEITKHETAIKRAKQGREDIVRSIRSMGAGMETRRRELVAARDRQTETIERLEIDLEELIDRKRRQNVQPRLRTTKRTENEVTLRTMERMLPTKKALRDEAARRGDMATARLYQREIDEIEALTEAAKPERERLKRSQARRQKRFKKTYDPLRNPTDDLGYRYSGS